VLHEQNGDFVLEELIVVPEGQDVGRNVNTFCIEVPSGTECDSCSQKHVIPDGIRSLGNFFLPTLGPDGTSVVATSISNFYCAREGNFSVFIPLPARYGS